MDKIILNTPIMINGKEVKELTYDTAEITAGQFCEADAYKFAASGNKPVFTTYEIDSGLHLFLGMMAVIAVNPHIDVKDMERIKGPDMLQLVRIGRNFIMSGASSESDQNSSGDLSEITPEPLDAAPEKSNN